MIDKAAVARVDAMVQEALAYAKPIVRGGPITEGALAAGVFTNDINISRRVSREVHAGTVWTNTWSAINDGFAEGGYKQSGVGRLRGPRGLAEFQEAKTVVHSIPPLDGAPLRA